MWIKLKIHQFQTSIFDRQYNIILYSVLCPSTLILSELVIKVES